MARTLGETRLAGYSDGQSVVNLAMSKFKWNPRRITELRTALGWSQEDLSREWYARFGKDSAVTRATISSWETGATVPKVEPDLLRLAELLSDGDVTAFFDRGEETVHGKDRETQVARRQGPKRPR